MRVRVFRRCSIGFVWFCRLIPSAFLFFDNFMEAVSGICCLIRSDRNILLFIVRSVCRLFCSSLTYSIRGSVSVSVVQIVVFLPVGLERFLCSVGLVLESCALSSLLMSKKMYSCAYSGMSLVGSLI